MDIAIGDLAGILFQALIVAEVVALITVRRRLGRNSVSRLGHTWQARLPALTRMARPTEGLALYFVLSVAIGAALAGVS
jgi:hypothetical protein